MEGFDGSGSHESYELRKLEARVDRLRVNLEEENRNARSDRRQLEHERKMHAGALQELNALVMVQKKQISDLADRGNSQFEMIMNERRKFVAYKDRMHKRMMELEAENKYLAGKLDEAIESIHIMWNMPCMPGGQEAIEKAQNSYRNAGAENDGE